ncbi:hypothetical protein DSO57_1007150 [Entomophthora muscae]|uniref:Uncharacterized protein n=1 Tax=Entomophthora muscae TaxID=34485 RepID=A0ACC2T7S8_9FUNG|nr:hypothetical protein DSO57_1007150 [Entomophthora muscae]
MQVTQGQVVGHGRILGEEQVASLYPFRTFSDFNLPEDNPQVLSLFTAADFPQLSPVQKKDVFVREPTLIGRLVSIWELAGCGLGGQSLPKDWR